MVARAASTFGSRATTTSHCARGELPKDARAAMSPSRARRRPVRARAAFPCPCENCWLARGEHQSLRARPFPERRARRPGNPCARGVAKPSRARPFPLVPAIRAVGAPHSWAFDGPRLRVRSPLLRGDAPINWGAEIEAISANSGSSPSSQRKWGTREPPQVRLLAGKVGTCGGDLWICLRLEEVVDVTRATLNPVRTRRGGGISRVTSGSGPLAEDWNKFASVLCSASRVRPTSRRMSCQPARCRFEERSDEPYCSPAGQIHALVGQTLCAKT